jgi:hypothetical protein
MHGPPNGPPTQLMSRTAGRGLPADPGTGAALAIASQTAPTSHMETSSRKDDSRFDRAPTPNRRGAASWGALTL